MDRPALVALLVLLLVALLALLIVTLRLRRLRRDLAAAGLALDFQLQRRTGLLLEEDEQVAAAHRVAAARLHYDEVAARWNAALRRFPANLVGRLLRFRPVPREDHLAG